MYSHNRGAESCDPDFCDNVDESGNPKPVEFSRRFTEEQIAFLVLARSTLVCIADNRALFGDRAVPDCTVADFDARLMAASSRSRFIRSLPCSALISLMPLISDDRYFAFEACVQPLIFVLAPKNGLPLDMGQGDKIEYSSLFLRNCRDKLVAGQWFNEAGWLFPKRGAEAVASTLGSPASPASVSSTSSTISSPRKLDFSSSLARRGDERMPLLIKPHSREQPSKGCWASICSCFWASSSQSPVSRRFDASLNSGVRP